MFARFDAIDARVNTVDARLEKLEAKQYDTEPIWERALKEIADLKIELVDTKRQLSRRLDRVESIVLEIRSDLSDLENRVRKPEGKPTQ